MPTPTSRPLSPKAQRFVDEYLVDLNATAAALRAGYSKRTAHQMGYELLQDARVQAAITAARDERAARVKVDQDYVLTNLTEVVERCMQRAPVMVREGRKMVQLKDDDDRNVWQFDSVGAVKALALLGKHTGGFVDRLAVGDKDGGPVKVELKIVHEVVDPAVASAA